MTYTYDRKKIMFLEKVGTLFAVIAGIFLSVASIVMFTNMVTRTAADINIRIVYELAQMCGAGVASFAIPYATIKRAHTDMDIITSHLPERVKNFLEGISGIITMAIMLFMVVILARYAYERTLTLESTTPSHFPIYIFRWTYAVGMFFTFVMGVLDMIDSFRKALGLKVIMTQEELDEIDGKRGEE